MAEGLFKQIDANVENDKATLLNVSHTLHDNPEIRYEEVKAAGWLTDVLRERGFEVQKGYGSLPTAFVATMPGKSEGPNVAVMCEYDALEGLGHACGHNVIATMGLGAGLALAPLMTDLPGTLTVLGTPAEEGGGGKVTMLEEGAFKNVDAAMMIHPSCYNSIGKPSLARVAWHVSYEGVPAHAAGSPHLGVNALDAIRLAFNGMDAMRQQVTPDTRYHAIIDHGGDAANIIPKAASLKVYIRAAAKNYLYDTLVPRMRNIFEGAALMTGTTVTINDLARPYENMIVNETLAARFKAHAERIGREIPPHTDSGTGSTDAGNVSQVLPTLHAYLQIDATARPHTAEFATAAKSALGDQTVLDGAKVMASLAAELLTQPELVSQAKREQGFI
ncbi:MAG: M20 family metallopeptidase [Deinococcota bacterium]